jgi:GAF domain-containing protein
MSAAPDRTLADPETIDDLRRQLAERTSERDEAERRFEECAAERDEGLAREAAMAEVLGVIDSSPGHLAPVFDAILEKAMHLCEAAFGDLGIFDGEQYRWVAAHGIPDFAEYSFELRPEGNTPLEQLTRGERLIHLADVRQSDAYRDIPAFRSNMDRRAVRSLLVVPLRKDGELLGAIRAYRQEVRPFSDKQIALMQNFAAQAVIAMENARLLGETREALEQQTATAEVLQVINASPGELKPVFDAMLDKALRLCEAAIGYLLTYDGERFQQVADRGLPARYVEYVRAQAAQPGPGGGQLRVLRGEPFVHFADMKDDEAYRSGTNPSHRAMVDLGGARTGLVVPLRKHNGLLGTFTIFRQEVRLFSEKQIALLQNFAAQAVIAMDNARLLTETREALERHAASAEVLGVISSSPGDLEPVFETIMVNAVRICDGTAGVLALRDGDGFRGAAAHGFGASFMENLTRLHRPVPGTTLDLVEREPRTVQMLDLLAVPAYDAIRSLVPEYATVRTHLAVPMIKEKELLGAILVYRDEVRPFDNKQIELVESFASQAVIAIENARLLGELRERTYQLEQSLEYQTATSDVLQLISRSTFDLQPVLDMLTETAARLCDADLGHIALPDGDAYRSAASFAFSDELRAYMRTLTFRRDRSTIVGRSAVERQVVHVADVRADPEHLLADREIAVLEVFRTALAVPLLREGEPIGVIGIGRQRVEPFTERQIELVRTFADQAVIAMENARLLGELRESNEKIATLNQDLEARVAAQVDELGRVGRLKRFLAPQLAEMIIAKGEERILESHRRNIVVVFCDLRGYTAFTETAEPEEVLDFLREYHGALGPLVGQYEGTLDQFSGDGIMVFFNDPVPCPDPAERAVRMAIAMREAASRLIASWRRRHSSERGFGVGIAQGYATLGQIGFSERSGYTAIGTVCNLAARLCAEAKDAQILVSSRVAGAVEGIAKLEDLGNLEIKGLSRPVAAFNVREPANGAPASG